MKADLCRKRLFLASVSKMARSYSRKKGKSGSTRPISDNAPEWANKDVKSVKELIVEMAKSGKTSSQIGMILRDSHAVPDVRAMAGSTVGVIIKEAGLKREIPDDLLALIKRDIDLAKHLETNKKKAQKVNCLLHLILCMRNRIPNRKKLFGVYLTLQRCIYPF